MLDSTTHEIFSLEGNYETNISLCTPHKITYHHIYYKIPINRIILSFVIKLMRFLSLKGS